MFEELIYDADPRETFMSYSTRLAVMARLRSGWYALLSHGAGN